MVSDFILQQSELADLAEKVEAGIRLEADDALRLYRTPDLNALGRLAMLAAERKVGNRATYIVNRYINYSNYCILSGENAVVGIVDVAVDDVRGAVTHLAFRGQHGQPAEGIEVRRAVQAEGVIGLQAYAGLHLLGEIGQFALLKNKIAHHNLHEIKRGTMLTSVTTIAINTRLIMALRLKKAFCTQSRLRLRAIQCSSPRHAVMTTMPIQ